MYYIIETQQNADGTAAILTYQEAEKNTALSKWHNILSYAAKVIFFISYSISVINYS